MVGASGQGGQQGKFINVIAGLPDVSKAGVSMIWCTYMNARFRLANELNDPSREAPSPLHGTSIDNIILYLRSVDANTGGC